jgi:hypothetical protein
MCVISAATKATATLGALLTCIGIAACAGSPVEGPRTAYDPAAKETYRRIFVEVLQKDFSAKTGLNICLPPLFGFGDVTSETIDVMPDTESAPMPGAYPALSRSAQLRALEAAGLVSSTETTRTVGNRTQRVLTYRRTALGQADSQGGAICYARAELDRVVKWKGPAVLGEYQVAFVYYTVKTVRIEPWAKAADIQAAFPSTSPIVRGEPAKVRQTVIDLSSEGWDIAEWSKYMQLQ